MTIWWRHFEKISYFLYLRNYPSHSIETFPTPVPIWMKKCQKKPKDVTYQVVSGFFQKYFVVHERSAVKISNSTYVWSKVECRFMFLRGSVSFGYLDKSSWPRLAFCALIWFFLNFKGGSSLKNGQKNAFKWW